MLSTRLWTLCARAEFKGYFLILDFSELRSSTFDGIGAIVCLCFPWTHFSLFRDEPYDLNELTDNTSTPLSHKD